MTLTATRSGTLVDLMSPRPAMILAADISEGLAKINRWAGASSHPFSVAQHSIEVAHALEKTDGPLAALYGLLHDAQEYVTGDVLEPTRGAIERVAGPAFGGALTGLRDKLDSVIHRALDLDWPRPDTIERAFVIAHARVVAAEVRDLLPSTIPRTAFVSDGAATAEPVQHKLRPFPTWVHADAAFRHALAAYVSACCIKRTRAFAGF